MSTKETLIGKARADFHARLLETVLSVSPDGVPSNADKDSVASVKIAKKIAKALGTISVRAKRAGQTSGKDFEDACIQFLEDTFTKLSHLRSGQWSLRILGQRESNALAQFEQYSHLLRLAEAVKKEPQLASIIGSDYFIVPDIVVARLPEPDSTINSAETIVDRECATKTPLRAANSKQPLIHASVSCKWTLRSDRAQNARSEALALIRNRKGRVPHIVAVTAEPLPARLASLALGTSDLDCVYHFALYELIAAVDRHELPDAFEMLSTLVDGKRLRDISDLPVDLCI
jgi:hypothetical protein